MHSLRSTWAATLVPVLLWLWLFHHLHVDWSINAQYSYGWAVPLLALLLAWQRWQDRPPISAPREPWRARNVRIALLACLLPIRLIEEANPDWRLLSWIFAIVVAAYSLASVWRIGGAKWMRHFAFVLCFPLVAVPWFTQIELFVVQGLARAVARVAVEIASWSGLGAYQLGNVIQLRAGFVGVDEACSGVRTLQSSIMLTLFLGELLRLSAKRRVLLVLAGCVWVFLCNIIRATALVSIAGFRGLPALQRWHDVVGSVVFVVGIAGILLLAWGVRRGGSTVVERRITAINPMAPLEIAVSCLWLAAIFGLTEVWYRSHERNLATQPAWQISWPGDSQSQPITDTVHGMLRFDTAQSAAWRDTNGAEWWGFFAHWNPGRAALALVRSHSPDICLPALGRTFVRELPPANLPLHFRVYQFEQQQKPLFVFVFVQDDKMPAIQTDVEEWSTRGRLLAVWQGRRNLGQRLLELAVIGPPNADAARTAVSRTVAALVRPAG